MGPVEKEAPGTAKETEARYELGLYKNLEEVLNIFRSNSDPISKEILQAFQTVCLYTEDLALPTGKRRPFIVIEGNYKPSTDAIGMKLANLLDGRYIAQVVPCLRRFYHHLEQGSPLRRPFLYLSLYASAFDARVQMTLNRAVVMNSYWTEQLTYTVTRSFHAGVLPPITAEFFQYPEDLMPPDLHIFLDFSESLYTTTVAPRFYQISNVRKPISLKKRKLEVYKHLQTMLPILIYELQRMSNRATADLLLAQIQANLSGTRNFEYKPTFDYSDLERKLTKC